MSNGLFFICEGIEVFRCKWDGISCLLTGKPCKSFKLCLFSCLSDLLANIPFSHLFQVVWWINLASLGLYLIMVAVSSIAIQRGISLQQERLGKFQLWGWLDILNIDILNKKNCACFRAFRSSHGRRWTSAARLAAALRPLLHHGPCPLLSSLLSCNALQ